MLIVSVIIPSYNIHKLKYMLDYSARSGTLAFNTSMVPAKRPNLFYEKLLKVLSNKDCRDMLSKNGRDFIVRNGAILRIIV